MALRWSLAFVAMVVESLPVRESLQRSWRITKSNAGRLLGVFALVYAIVLVLVVVPISLILTFVSLFVMSGNEEALFRASVTIGQPIAVVFFVPSAAACYYRLRGPANDTTGNNPDDFVPRVP